MLDTLGDLKKRCKLRIKCQKNGHKNQKEDVRLAIGNGVAKLIQRTVPNGISKEEYDSTLEIFKIYYGNNYDIETKPYPGLLKMLKKIKKRWFFTSGLHKQNSSHRQLFGRSLFSWIVRLCSGR